MHSDARARSFAVHIYVRPSIDANDVTKIDLATFDVNYWQMKISMYLAF